jgi:hypothetical protein
VLPNCSKGGGNLIGTVKEATGVFRSTDKGATWLRVNDKAHQWGAIGSVGVITGDPDTYGRVYVDTNGRGLQYGDPSCPTHPSGAAATTACGPAKAEGPDP